MDDILMIDKMKIEVTVTSVTGNSYDGTIVWLRPIYKNYFESSIRLKEYNGYVNFVLKVESEGKITPICNSNTYSEAEFAQLNLARQLGLNIRNLIIERRIKEIDSHGDLCMECE